MTLNAYVQLIFYMAVLLLLAKPLGWYMARVYDGQPAGLNRLLAPVERGIYRLLGTREDREMNWKQYRAITATTRAPGRPACSGSAPAPCARPATAI